MIPTAYRPEAAAQTAYAHGAGNGQDMQDYMTSQGFGTDYFSGGTLCGVSTTGFNWNTMSSPAMDLASGGTSYHPELSIDQNLAGMNPAMKQYFQSDPNAAAEYAADPFNFASDRGLVVHTPHIIG